jgi:hypothetical protein
MDIKGFKAYNGGVSAEIRNGSFIGQIAKQKLEEGTGKKFNKVFDYMRLENLKEYLKDPKIISSSNMTLIVGKIKSGVTPDDIFKKDLEYCDKIINKPPLLGLDNSNLPALAGKEKGIIKIDDNFITVKTDKNLNLPEEFVYQGEYVQDNPLTVRNNDSLSLNLTRDVVVGGKENLKLKEFKAPNTADNKKKLLLAVNPQAGRWQVEGEETMKNIATAIHRFADMIPHVHYGELTPELAKKGFDTLNGHISKGLGLKL